MMRLRNLCLIGFTFLQLLSFAGISVNISDNNISPAETTQLTITLTGAQVQGTPPDTKVLEQDFEILNRSQSQSISIINGHTERELQWIYTLLPKRAGTLKIPALKIGKETTASQTINVSQQSASTQDNIEKTADLPPVVFLEVDMKHKEAYINSQVRYRVRLFYAENIMNGTLTDPSVSNANILRLPQDKNYQKRFKGRLYQVLERDYAIFPEKSGQLTIHGPAFSGLRNQQENTFSQFDPFYNTAKVPVRLFADTKTITVKPIPNEIQPSEWLPASRVELSDQWRMPNKMEVGQPITRLATLRVYGSTQAQLPDLNTIQADGIKVYADEPVTQNLSEGDNIIAEKTQKFTYIPTKSGVYALPPTVVKWWNVESNKIETTRIEGKTVNVKAIPSEVEEQRASKPVTKQPLPLIATANQDKASSFNTMLAIFFLALWVITMILWWFQNQSKKNFLQSPKRALKRLIKACDHDNPKLIEQRMLAWAKTQWPNNPPRNLVEISNRITDLNFKTEIKFLESAIYGNNPNWTAKGLKDALTKYRVQKNASVKEDDLPGLYPDLKK